MIQYSKLESFHIAPAKCRPYIYILGPMLESFVRVPVINMWANLDFDYDNYRIGFKIERPVDGKDFFRFELPYLMVDYKKIEDCRDELLEIVKAEVIPDTLPYADKKVRERYLMKEYHEYVRKMVNDEAEKRN